MVNVRAVSRRNSGVSVATAPSMERTVVGKPPTVVHFER